MVSLMLSEDMYTSSQATCRRNTCGGVPHSTLRMLFFPCPHPPAAATHQLSVHMHVLKSLSRSLGLQTVSGLDQPWPITSVGGDL